MLTTRIDPNIYSRTYEQQIRSLAAERARGIQDDTVSTQFAVPHYYKKPLPSQITGARFVFGLPDPVETQNSRTFNSSFTDPQDLARNLALSHSTLESPAGKQTKRALDLPFEEHSRIDLMKALHFWAAKAQTLGRQGKNAFNKASNYVDTKLYDTISSALDKNKDLRSALEKEWIPLGRDKYFKDIEFLGMGGKFAEVLEKYPKAAQYIATVGAAAFGLLEVRREVMHLFHSAHKLSHREKPNSPFSGLLFSGALLLGSTKVSGLFSELAKKYPGTVGHVYSTLRVILNRREILTDYLMHHPNDAIQFLGRSLVYAEGVSLKYNTARFFNNPSIIIGRALKAVSFTAQEAEHKEDALVEKALSGIKGKGILADAEKATKGIKFMGGLLGLAFASAGYLRAAGTILDFLHHIGLHEDMEQKREDRRIRREYQKYKKLKYDDSPMPYEQFASELSDNYSIRKKISASIKHPFQHVGNYLGVGAYIGTQFLHFNKELDSGALKLAWGKLLNKEYKEAYSVIKPGIDVFGKTHPHAIWSAYGTAAVWGALTGKTWEQRLGSLGLATSEILADKLALLALNKTLSTKVGQAGVAKLLKTPKSILEVLGVSLKPANDWSEKAVKIENHLKGTSVMKEAELKGITGDLSRLLMEPAGALIGIPLWIYSSRILKGIGRGLDAASRKNSLNQEIRNQEREDRKEDDAPSTMQKAHAKVKKSVKNHSHSKANQRARHNRYKAGHSPHKQEQQSKKPGVSVHTHVKHEDVQVDLNILAKSIGSNHVSYSSYNQ